MGLGTAIAFHISTAGSASRRPLHGKYMRFKKASHGPYCCDGAACPKAHEFAVEQNCLLPAASLFTLPHCSRLRGTASVIST